MSKAKSDGDVLANKMSLVQAKGQKFLASLLSSQPVSSTETATTETQDTDDDLKGNYAHDRLGVGGIVPKDIEDGSFTKRTPTSNDKLLEQLLGRKRAKAHQTAQQDLSRPGSKPQKQGRSTLAKKEESEDEEEGRAATFKSKRIRKPKPKPAVEDESDDEDEESRAKRLKTGTETPPVHDEVTKELEAPASDEDSAPKQAPRKTKAKPKSFLDEILAERSKKRHGKAKR